ncbi:hypothetical protein FLK61_31655 [Paenalkalicoccus suaedae]|uniref:CBS domain-containing protein n=1 Tax=Paenalkalicoccus suaedae TaxID=2592382 RepID=A0A859FDV0_9BACI|nr:DUF294 nucleotidyltransferase-like domain-containing protein [Paenalkalicoccus suaedae]QKS71267.1 hypothetical protein FLK61_31655 [Paenalkalicoccus suaedae]
MSTLQDPTHIPTYDEIRDELVNERQTIKSPQELNELHDDVMKKIVRTAQYRTESEHGPAPARFTFLLLGSAGRHEQSYFSDQDHALVHYGSDKETSFFLQLGEEIVEGMEYCGYERCDGKVMASEARWCKSEAAWRKQIEDYANDASFDSIRYLLILADSRDLHGDPCPLKEHLLSIARFRKEIRRRFVSNIQFKRRMTTLFGQLLTDQHGYINVKEELLFPYVNAIRVASIIEGIKEASTLERMQKLREKVPKLAGFEGAFKEALQFRHDHTSHVQSYEDVHHIRRNDLSRDEQKKLKHLMLEGRSCVKATTSYYQEGKKE